VPEAPDLREGPGIGSTLLRDGTIWAGERPRPGAGWLLVEDGRVAAYGRADELPPDAHRTVELGGGHVLPGFTDAHTHLATGSWIPFVGDGSSWRCAGDALASVREAASHRGDGWIVFTRYDPHSWDDPALPTRTELDDAAGSRPVLLMDLSLHMGVASSEALRRSGVAWLPGSDRDVERGRHGRPSGTVWERAFGRAMFAALRGLAAEYGGRTADELLERAAAHHLSLGIVRAHDPGVPSDVAERLERLRRRSPLRLSWSSSPDRGLLEPPARVGELERGSFGEGPAQAKLFLDGAYRCALCLPPRVVVRGLWIASRAALERWDPRPLLELGERPLRLRGREVITPELRRRDAELRPLVDAIGAAGLRPRVHALGNRAVLQAVRVLEAAGTPPGWTLEHVIGLRNRDIEEVARSGAIASLQPGFLPHYAPAFRASGAMPDLRLIPLRSLLDAGVGTAISSDHPCGPLDPLKNLRLAVTRRLPDGGTLDAREAIGREEAVLAATGAGCRAAGVEAPGVLVPGAPADLVVVDGDPFVASSRVVGTWIDGRWVA
jgi:predicted amidohydrolase YtcJ